MAYATPVWHVAWFGLPMLEADARIARKAAANNGVLTREMLRELGLSDRSVERRLSTGTLERIHPSVYRSSGYPDTWRSRVRAAFLWAREGALLTGGTALTLHGVEGLGHGPPEILVLGRETRTGIRCHRIGRDLRLKRRPLDGMWTVTIERALLDACRHHSAIDVGKAMDDALRKKLTTVARLQKESAQTRLPGISTFRRLVALRDPDDEKVRSEMETKMLRVLRKIKTHDFKPNLLVIGRQGRYYLDFAVPQLMLCIECRSRQWHDQARLEQDAARHNDLTLMGWRILYFTWDDIVFRPNAVQRDITEALGTLFCEATR